MPHVCLICHALPYTFIIHHRPTDDPYAVDPKLSPLLESIQKAPLTAQTPGKGIYIHIHMHIYTYMICIYVVLLCMVYFSAVK